LTARLAPAKMDDSSSSRHVTVITRVMRAFRLGIFGSE
jgi:hypothetical protein